VIGSFFARLLGSTTWWAAPAYCILNAGLRAIGLNILPDPAANPEVPLGIAGAVGLKEAARRVGVSKNEILSLIPEALRALKDRGPVEHPHDES